MAPVMAQAPGSPTNEEHYSQLFSSYVSELPQQPKIQVKPASIWRDVIRAAATRNGANPDLAERIAYCESGFKPEIHNKASTASGLFQFLDSTFSHYAIGGYDKYGKPYGYFLTKNMADKNDPYIQIETATRMLADGGAHHWDASKSCWAR